MPRLAEPDRDRLFFPTPNYIIRRRKAVSQGVLFFPGGLCHVLSALAPLARLKQYDQPDAQVPGCQIKPTIVTVSSGYRLARRVPANWRRRDSRWCLFLFDFLLNLEPARDKELQLLFP